MSALNDATRRQNQAAEPGFSTWLSANAGSGKTRVLTDRVARLLLDGVAPQNILCLTYTKAAASEMQNRLFKRLGEWSMLPDGELAQALAALGVSKLSHDHIARARRLFAAAIETPGGLRIQTIHSFCASLLRRFPLEAGVSPRFTEMDDRAAALLRDEIIETLASGPNVAAIDAIATYLSDADLSRLAMGVVNNRQDLGGKISADEIWDWLDLRPGYSAADLIAETFVGPEKSLFKALIPVLTASTKTTDNTAALRLAAQNFAQPDLATLQGLTSLLLFGGKAASPFGAKIGKFPTKDSRTALGPLADDLDELMERVEGAREVSNRLYTGEKSLALHQFADAFLPVYVARKQARGWLDFDDLIQKARDLLTDPAVAAWVLYRLDGGLDHILVDEAQDTSPAQWQVIERLAQEFTAGHGARDDKVRTIFVVGDRKQSIYSFQGADPREFDRMRAHFEDRLKAIGVALRPMELEYSFRSSPAILRFVDQVIDQPGNPHLIPDTRHLAFHADLPGRVDLWAPVAVTEKPEKPNWFDPVDIVGTDHHDVILARSIADQIAKTIATDTIPAENSKRRPVNAGDILILVRRRSRLFEEIIRACKARNLPVAGADRLKLGGELAVKDLSALLSFLATPEDDLSLAAALRSPLFGWTEAQLYDLAAGRSQAFLWAALRNNADDHPDTIAMLRDLLDRSDFLRPYDLIERILTRHDGRRRLLARLGPEAEDGIDALLNQSLAFERVEVPSLTGFLVWMQTDDVQVKRQMDSAGDLIRVMTVHGAKGLESPIVILPDTAKRRVEIRDEIVPLEAGKLIWKPVADRQPETVIAALTCLKAAQQEEDLRLFYVAMTRAETWLIIAASGEIGDTGDSWYQMAASGIETLGHVPIPSPTGPGLRYVHGDWNAGELIEAKPSDEKVRGLPNWAISKVDTEERAQKPRAPSNLGGAKALFSDVGDTDLEDALREGRRVHRLLEHLPGTPAEHRQDLAIRLLATGEDSANPDEVSDLMRRIAPVLNAPDLAHLFGDTALSEVAISAELPELDGARISGAIDRLIFTPGRVLAVDFKTNAVIPDTPQATPEGIQRQMGAYLAALKQIYPDRAVEVAILWTTAPLLMPLPDNIVMNALRRTPHLDDMPGRT